LIFNNVVAQYLHCESIKEEVCVEIAGRIGGMGGFKIETSHKSIMLHTKDDIASHHTLEREREMELII
jgi:hypothetical protein